jgi:hypothetical protein
MRALGRFAGFSAQNHVQVGAARSHDTRDHSEKIVLLIISQVPAQRPAKLTSSIRLAKKDIGIRLDPPRQSRCLRGMRI